MRTRVSLGQPLFAEEIVVVAAAKCDLLLEGETVDEVDVMLERV